MYVSWVLLTAAMRNLCGCVLSTQTSEQIALETTFVNVQYSLKYFCP
jgi:hypothetical protein